MYLLSTIILSALATIAIATPLSTRDTTPFTDAGLTIKTFASKDCQNPTNSISTAVFYGIDYHAQVNSYSLSRNLNANEQLDFSTGGDPGTSNIDKQCAAFQYVASLDKNNQPLVAKCYDTIGTAGVSLFVGG